MNRLIDRRLNGRGKSTVNCRFLKANGRLTETLMERGLLAKETHTHTVRFAPPLIVTAPRSSSSWT